MTAGSVVLDASILLRFTVTAQPEARDWIRSVEAGDVEGHVPELAYAEFLSGLVQYVRAGEIDAARASSIVEQVVELPLVSHRQPRFAAAALALALQHGLSAYDAAYVALADALDVPLVTADRRLAGAAARAELVT